MYNLECKKNVSIQVHFFLNTVHELPVLEQVSITDTWQLTILQKPNGAYFK